MNTAIAVAPRPMKYCLPCRAWTSEEKGWLDLFLATRQADDQLTLTICLPQNRGLNRMYVESQLAALGRNGALASAVEVIEENNPAALAADYWLATPACQNSLAKMPEERIIRDKSLKGIYTPYEMAFPRKNLYEYELLVNAYDFEKFGQGTIEKDGYRLPKQFGSTGGARLGEILRLIDASCRPEAGLLEVGCGAGIFHRILSMNNRPYRYTGVDRSRKQIIRCQENYPDGDFRVEDASAMSLADESHDFVFEHNALIFIPKVFKAIEEMFRVAKGFVSFTLDAALWKKGCMCYQSMLWQEKIDPSTGKIIIPEENQRFISPYATFEQAGDRAKIMSTRIPFYLPGKDELDEFLARLAAERGFRLVERRSGEAFKKPVIMNRNKSDAEIENDDFLYDRDDQIMEILAENISFFFAKTRS